MSGFQSTMSAMSPPWNAGHNPHIQKFMARKAPKPIEPRKVVHKAETETICAYPKGDSLTQTVTCAQHLAKDRTHRDRGAPLPQRPPILHRLAPPVLTPYCASQEEHEHANGGQGFGFGHRT